MLCLACFHAFYGNFSLRNEELHVFPCVYAFQLYNSQVSCRRNATWHNNFLMTRSYANCHLWYLQSRMGFHQACCHGNKNQNKIYAQFCSDLKCSDSLTCKAVKHLNRESCSKVEKIHHMDCVWLHGHARHRGYLLFWWSSLYWIEWFYLLQICCCCCGIRPVIRWNGVVNCWTQYLSAIFFF